MQNSPIQSPVHLILKSVKLLIPLTVMVTADFRVVILPIFLVTSRYSLSELISTTWPPMEAQYFSAW